MRLDHEDTSAIVNALRVAAERCSGRMCHNALHCDGKRIDKQVAELLTQGQTRAPAPREGE